MTCSATSTCAASTPPDDGASYAEEIRADILAVEKETEGLLGEIIGA